MLYPRLIELIESHADEVTARVLAVVHSDTRLPGMQSLSDTELVARFDDVCRRLSQWLTAGESGGLIERYEALGRQRCLEGIALYEVVCAGQIFERELIRYAREQPAEMTALDLYSEAELERMIRGFFDRVILHLVRGYEQALREEAGQPAKRPVVHPLRAVGF